MRKIMYVILFILLVSIVAAEQPTMVGLQGRVTDSAGVPVNNGNLRATVSTTASCEQNIIYDYTFSSAVRAGLFSVLLGNDSNLNLTYNQDYFLCTYINGEVQRNLGGSNTTKFRGGHGIIGAGNLTNGTFVNGNYTFADNLSLGATLYVKNDEEFLYRVLRAPIKYKDLVDRSSEENITGEWNFSNGNTVLGGIPVSDIGAGEWELVSYTNVSSTAGWINVSLSNSEYHKIEYTLWHELKRTDRGDGQPDYGYDLDAYIKFYFNNKTLAPDKKIYFVTDSGSAVAKQGDAGNFTLATWSSATWVVGRRGQYVRGTLFISQLGNGSVEVSNSPLMITGMNGTTSVLTYGHQITPSKISEINFYGNSLVESPHHANNNYGLINGTIRVYKHRNY